MPKKSILKILDRTYYQTALADLKESAEYIERELQGLRDTEVEVQSLISDLKNAKEKVACDLEMCKEMIDKTIEYDTACLILARNWYLIRKIGNEELSIAVDSENRLEFDTLRRAVLSVCSELYVDRDDHGNRVIIFRLSPEERIDIEAKLS